MSSVLLIVFHALALSVLAGCGVRWTTPYPKGAEPVAAGSPAPETGTSVIPPTPVTGSYLSSVLVNIDGSPRRGVKVVIEGSGLELETNSNGEIKIPLVNIDSVVIVLKILDGGQVVLSDVELPADIAKAISQVRVDSGIAPVAGAPAVTATPKTPDSSTQTAVLEPHVQLVSATQLKQ